VGILHQRTQDYRSARHYYRGALQQLRSSSLPSDRAQPLTAFASQAQADLLLEQTLSTNFELDSLRRVQQLARQGRALAEPGTERHARLSSILSESLGYLGMFDEAYRLNNEVLQYARSHDNARLETFSLLKLGVLHVQTERWSRADSVLCEALTQAQALGDLDYQRRILRTLGRLHEMQEDWQAAEKYYREGVSVIEEYRESLTASQWSMTAFAQWREVYRGLVRALLAQDRPREAFVALDQSRARHLQDLRTQARVSNQLPPEKRTRLDSLSRTLTDVRNRLGNNDLSDDEAASLRNRETRLMAARQQLLQLDTTASRPSPDAIMNRLADQDRALVSYFLDDPWPVFDRAPRSAAFVLTNDTLRTVSLPGLTQDSVRRHVEAVSPLFSSRESNQANAMHFDLRPLHTLHDAVYAPVAEQLPPDQPLTVVPDGPLFHLPFSMLVHAMPGGHYAPSEARYVLHDRPTSLELASSLVVDSARQTIDWAQYDPQLAAYGVSDFDTLRTVPSALRDATPATDSTLALSPLPGVQAELEAIESSIANAHVSLNGEATEANVRGSAQVAGVLHVASHAFVNKTSPLRNAIVLRPGPARRATAEPRRPGERGASSDGRVEAAGAETDGVLFLHELQNQKARLPMVVLSGCNTAAGRLRSGEGMESLQYAFRAMGARSTVATLWPAADQPSVELMQSFYQHLRDGQPKDVALRQAQLAFLEKHPQKASPFFWASTTLYGSTVPLPLEAPPLVPGWAWWALGLAGGGLLLLLVWWRPTLFPGSRRFFASS
ncbi:MAG TPA: CHAT domain-containing tetratricopeptide repeat protein, partial [Salinibacter sp.]|nr:CHAT domain-containing tetratricopeptide repeat protein [Salinibacter sp.]